MENTQNEEIPTRSFTKDLEESNDPIMRNEWNAILEQIFKEGSEIQWKDDMVSQLDFGSDVLVKTKQGRRYSVDTKTKRFDYYDNGNYTLEIVHHRYSDKTKAQKLNTKEGWLYNSTSEIILFGTLNKEKNKIIEVCAFTMAPFKEEEFKERLSGLPNAWASTEFDNGKFQLTLNKIVDTKFLEEHAYKFWYFKR